MASEKPADLDLCCFKTGFISDSGFTMVRVNDLICDKNNSKFCRKGPLKNRQNKGLKDKW